MMNLKELKNNNEINTYIQKADDVLKAIGYTEHCFSHVNIVSNNAKKILKTLEYSEREIELAGIAGYMHDIGNIINRVDHAQSGAILTYNILSKLDFNYEDIADIVSAIGNHDEGTGEPINPITAALIIADKSDVRRNRVRSKMGGANNIHYRVNYAVQKSSLTIYNDIKDNRSEGTDKRILELNLIIDTDICSVCEYFKIYLNRMELCIKSAKVLDSTFSLVINGQKLA